MGKRLLLTSLLAGGLVTTAAACSDDLDDTTFRSFIVQVDSVDAPGSVFADSALNVRLVGVVGPNGCFALDSIVVDKQPSDASITAHGTETMGSEVVCTSMIVGLDSTVTVAPPHQDSVVLLVQQPTGGPTTVIVPVNTPG